MPEFIESLVAAEIRRMIAEAKADGGLLSASQCAARILLIDPNCGLAETEIADQIMMWASSAGLAVQLGQEYATFPRSAGRPSKSGGSPARPGK